MVLVMVLVGLVVGRGVESQTLCNMSMGELVACRPYVSRPPARGKPASLCCSGLKKADWGCLCTYRNNNMLSYYGVDPNLALQLPSKCGLPAPPPC
ncbi:hypothetical protein QJS10_CPA06g01094 [Acorus calamus]|uniref:Bifunctional inhibitor/plant lipid transfer protein/seed storage helical domain-containing protein n=1 Tax=Acorus calamus TaxID=4465 RepID=A0AAV9EJN7_ACOCL|nr:hypothetical protein QJS10_CPA06g01094 [Acorus calamus]